MWRRIRKLSGCVIQCACLTHLTFTYIGDIVICSGPSMQPTLEPDNILLTEHITPKLNKIQRGDIVIAKNPSNPTQNICKRVAGLPGDVMKRQYNLTKELVPRGHVWLEGDNSSNSADSRIYGPVPLGLIKSRALLRIWPLDRISFLT